MENAWSTMLQSWILLFVTHHVLREHLSVGFPIAAVGCLHANPAQEPNGMGQPEGRKSQQDEPDHRA